MIRGPAAAPACATSLFPRIALSPDGARIALVGTESTPAAGTIHFMDLDAAGKLKPVVAFKAPQGNNPFPRVIKSVNFVDNEHVWTVSDGGQVHLWKIPEAKSIFSTSIPLPFAPMPRFSPGGKFVLLKSDFNYVLCNALNGDLVGTLPPSLVASDPAFSPDGRQIVGIAGSFLAICTLQEDAPVRKIPLPAQPGKLAWISDNLILARDMTLFDGLLDVSAEMIVWRYTHATGVTTLISGDQCFSIQHPAAAPNNRQPAPPHLVVEKIPDATTLAALKKINMDTALAIRPGVSVSLQINLPDPELVNRVTKNYTDQLTALGIKVADNQAVKIIATVKQTAPQVEMRTIRIEEKGQPIWDINSLGPPPGAPNQSIDHLAFFDKVKLPAKVPALRQPPGFGETILGAPRTATPRGAR